jgi:O-antigen ligase
MAAPDPPRWYDCIGHRRRWVSDLTWYGLGLVIAGVSALNELGSWVRWLGLPIVLAGLMLLGWSVRRRLRVHR